ncbi:ECF RNA polymerase sigma factor SigW [Novipirellula aureliae]|uniref:RNA polymerase sigma factor n=1 Tax=Novipirellula aureliae TaxID=2527966 RepID=A0A5C6DPQ9_9BACT|nr:sigma-70 family RNA polymerase sigma factor [Novipirellula aureliae]TWU37837.1 ECF RNA polymerase sigma factor SigW [Novipirellula aureliae]
MDTGIPDEQLMQLVAQGDLKAFELLVLRHQKTAWRTAYRLVSDHQAAEDLTQDAFVKIFEAADRYRPIAAFGTYLYRVVVRVCLDYLRKHRPEPTEYLGTDLGPAERSLSPDQQAVIAEQEQRVRVALHRLPAKQRTAVVLRYYEGLRGREIADAMAISVKAVERLLARGRKSLETLLTDIFEN